MKQFAYRNYLDEEELESLAVDDSELFTIDCFSLGLDFGGRPLGFAFAFVLDGGIFLRTASVSLSEELSGEKMLFFLSDIILDVLLFAFETDVDLELALFCI